MKEFKWIENFLNMERPGLETWTAKQQEEQIEINSPFQFNERVRMIIRNEKIIVQFVQGQHTLHICTKPQNKFSDVLDQIKLTMHAMTYAIKSPQDLTSEEAIKIFLPSTKHVEMKPDLKKEVAPKPGDTILLRFGNSEDDILGEDSYIIKTISKNQTQSPVNGQTAEETIYTLIHSQKGERFLFRTDDFPYMKMEVL